MYLALAVSTAGFPQASRVPRYSRLVAKKSIDFHLPGCHRLWPRFPAGSINQLIYHFSSLTTLPPYNPANIATDGLGSSPFARRY